MNKYLVPDYVYKARETQTETYKKPVTEEDVAFLEQMFFEQPRLYPDEMKDNLPRFEYVVRAGYTYLHTLAERVRYVHADKLVSAGDQYYDWKYLAEPISQIENPIFICAGAGINISFEIALAEQFPNARAIILDPSPQSVKHFEDIELPRNLDFVSDS